MVRVIRRSKWLVVRWTIFLGIVLTVLAVCFLLNKIDFVIHQKVQSELQQRFVAARVSVDSAHLSEGEGIVLSRFVLSPKIEQSAADATPFPPVISAERVVLKTSTDLKELALESPPITEILFDTATIRTYRRPDGSWSLESLKVASDEDSSAPSPAIRFKNTTIEVHDMRDTQTDRRLVLRNAELIIDTSRPADRDAGGQPFQPARQVKCFPFHGTAESEFCHLIRFTGRFYPDPGEIRVDAEVEELQYSEDFRGALPLEIADKLESLREIRGEISTQVAVVSSLKDFNNAKFYLNGKLSDGRALNAKLPRTLLQISTDFQIVNDGFILPNLAIRHGDGSANLVLRQTGFGPTAKREIQSKIRDIELSEDVYALLPDTIQNLLRQLAPTGKIDMEGTFTFDGTVWNMTGKIACRDASITYEKFPYRLENLQGEIVLAGSNVQFHFAVPDGAVTLEGDFSRFGGGSVRVNAKNVPVEERLLAACPQSAAMFVRSLEMSGGVNVAAAFQIPKTGSMDSRISIQLLNNACRYRKFPYPLRNVRGSIEVVNNRISGKNLCGENGHAQVALSFEAQMKNNLLISTPPGPESVGLPASGWNPVSTPYAGAGDMFALSGFQPENRYDFVGNWDLNLRIVGANVSLDDELYENLPDSASQIFQYVRPTGLVHLDYSLEFRDGKQQHLAISVEPVEPGLTLTFPKLPYRLEHFRGQLIYRDGSISLPNFQAEHGTSKIAGKLTGRGDSKDRWNCRFENLTVDGVRIDRELLLSFPAEIRTTLAARRPDGLLYYNGSLDLNYDATRERPFVTRWAGEVGMAQAGLDFGFKLTNIAGGIQIAGRWDGTDFLCAGELDIDSLFYEGVQFSEVRGPLWIDNRQIILGGNAQRMAQNQLNFAPDKGSPSAQRALSTHFVGGDLYGNCVFLFGYPSTFRVNVVLTNGRLEDCAYLTGNDQLKGKLVGTLTLAGTEASLHSLRGSGEMHLSDADVYKLSVMMSLLKILSLKEVSDNAFGSADARFRIEGNHVYFEQLDFYGDAFSLIGKGEMDFRRQVQLVFYSVIGRGERDIPLISPLLHITGRQMMLITMKGPIQNPQITPQPLPGLNMAIQQIEKDFRDPPLLPRSSRPGGLLEF